MKTQMQTKPAVEWVEIEKKDINSDIVITNLLGEEKMNLKLVQESTSIEVASLPKGIYIITIKKPNG